MIAESREHVYEAVRKLDMGKILEHYVCTADGEDTGKLYHVVRNGKPETFPALLSFLASLRENPGFTDLEEIILKDRVVFLVFPFPGGVTLKELLAGEVFPDLKTRFEVGRELLEALILQMFPLELLWDVLESDRIWINPAAISLEGFLYDLEDACEAKVVSEEDVFSRLGIIWEDLFAPELKNGLYPEVAAFVGISAGKSCHTVMDCYQEYVKLSGAASEERKLPEKKKKERFVRLKKLAKHKKILAVLFLLLTVICMAAAAGPYIWREAVFPYIEAACLVKTMAADAPETAFYSGRVLLTDPDSGNAVFSGRLLEGRKEGRGRTFYAGGRSAASNRGKGPIPLYDGYFTADRYEGEGILYDRNGNMEYEGGFVKGRREGDGAAYDARGRLLYKGGFLDDLYDGQGKLYSEGALIYEGGFHRGLFDGEGTRYEDGAVTEKGAYTNGRLSGGTAVKRDKNGRISYRGGWNDEGRSGEGTAYENGLRIYEGAFKDDKYDGEGKLYSPNTGDLIYEGGFVEGEYSGEGKLYEPGRRYLIYEGGFRLGEYDGEGKEYDEDGNLRYDGKFRLGLYNGPGIYYEPYTGIVIEEGEFRNGMLVTPKAVLEALEGAGASEGEPGSGQDVTGAEAEVGESGGAEAETQKSEGAPDVAEEKTPEGESGVKKAETPRGESGVKKADTPEGESDVAEEKTLEGESGVKKAETSEGESDVAEMEMSEGAETSEDSSGPEEGLENRPEETYAVDDDTAHQNTSDQNMSDQNTGQQEIGPGIPRAGKETGEVG